MPALSELEEQLERSGDRKGLGAYFTPPAVVEGLLALALDPLLEAAENAGAEAVASIRVLDPACGDGNFLVSVLARLRRSLISCGVSAADAGRLALRGVVGIDLDERASDACRLRLAEVAGVSAGDTVQVWTADSLLMPHETPLTLFAEADAPTWNAIRAKVGAVDGFDLVIGNPPFLSQLHTDTAFDRRYAAALKERFGCLAGGYTEPAGLFLVVGSELLAPSGRLCLIEPISVLASKSCGPVRESLVEVATLEVAWFPEGLVFKDVAVDVWAPIFVAGNHAGATRLHVGSEREAVTEVALTPGDGDSWSPLLAAVRGVPQDSLRTSGVLRDVASAIADFRDQYYGLVDAVVEYDPDVLRPKLVTAGLIDPALLLWGKRPTRFNKREFQAPCVDLSRLSDEMRAWAEARLVPKVLVATQTRILEAVVDEDGSLLPSVPVLTVTSSQVDPWQIGALLGSPPIAALAARRHLGAALSSDALKLSAADVLELPLPAHHGLWASAAKYFRRASETGDKYLRRTLLRQSASEMCSAFGSEDAVGLVEWWEKRLPSSLHTGV